jgi:hypothetical protein
VRTYTHTIWARLDDIRIGESRARGVDVAKVERYREWLERGRVAPPVRLIRDGDGFVVRDGRHRVFAAIAAGYAVIEAELRSFITTLVGRTVLRLAGRLSVPQITGTRLWWQGASLATRKQWVRLPPSPLWGRSTNEESVLAAGSWQASVVSTDKHAPFVRPRCGFDSCRRLLADVAQTEEHRTANPEMPVRDRSSASLGTWCNWRARRAPNPEVQVRILASLLVAGRSGWVISEAERAQALRFDSAVPTRTPRPRRHPAAGRNGSGYRHLSERSRVRVPPGALPAPVAQSVEH